MRFVKLLIKCKQRIKNNDNPQSQQHDQSCTHRANITSRLIIKNQETALIRTMFSKFVFFSICIFLLNEYVENIVNSVRLV